MKQVRIFIGVAIVSLLSFFTVDGASNVVNTNSLPVELKIAGTFKSQPLVQLNFTATSEDNVFKIQITDEPVLNCIRMKLKELISQNSFY